MFDCYNLKEGMGMGFRPIPMFGIKLVIIILLLRESSFPHMWEWPFLTGMHFIPGNKNQITIWLTLSPFLLSLFSLYLQLLHGYHQDCHHTIATMIIVSHTNHHIVGIHYSGQPLKGPKLLFSRLKINNCFQFWDKNLEALELMVDWNIYP